MAITLFHGDQADVSTISLETALSKCRAQGIAITTLDGKKITPAALTDALEQEDFFGGARLVVIRGLFTRPKSKLRDALLAIMADSSTDIYLYEAKKLTAAAIKPLGKITSVTSPDAKTIWALVRLLAPDNNNRRFTETYQKTLAEAAGSADPGIYILATILWQVQQLIDVSTGHFHGAPFAKTQLENQARKFPNDSLIKLYEDLIWLDYKAKTGQLALPVATELYLFLTGVR